MERHMEILLKIKSSERLQYILDMAQNNSNLCMFYDVGAKSFLTTSSSIGNKKTFYMHALRFYILAMVNITFDRHGVGIGIFNMQGFERRNKKSNNTLQRFSNNKGDTVIGNLRRL